MPELTDEELAAVRAVLPILPKLVGGTAPPDLPKSKTEAEKAAETAAAAVKPVTAAGSAGDVDAALEKALADWEAAEAAKTGDVTDDPSKELVAAGADLSAEARRAIDLAKAEGATAKQMAVAMRRELWDSKLAGETEALLSKGYSPAVINLAKPLLYGDGVAIDDPSVIDLATPADGTKPTTVNVAERVRKLLDELGPQIDLSAEHPFAVRPTEQSNTKALLDSWEQRDPTGSTIYGKENV